MKRISPRCIFRMSVVFIILYGSIAAAQSQRSELFDHNWMFSLGDNVSWSNPETDDSGWRKLDLPHDWSIEGKVEPQNPSGRDGGYFPTGTGWYRKTFQAQDDWKGKLISVYFEGVYMNAEVYLNGKRLGKYPYGYSSFSFDLTPHLHFSGENVMAVRVDNSQQKNCRWYSGSGIYRHVWLIATAPVHVAQWGMAVTTPEVSEKKATVLVKTLIHNKTSFPQTIRVQTEIKNASLKIVGKHTQSVTIAAHGTTELAGQIEVSKPMLWSPETPRLYTAIVKLNDSKTTLDEITTEFGIRSIAFSVGKGFQLNGKTLKLNGGCVHHDNGCLGAAAYDRAEERKVELLKAAGFNAVRTAHNPPSTAFLRACDRLGMLVIDEAFDGWREEKNPFDYASIFDEWWKRDVQAMVLRDRNHPSIVMWSTGNEIIERKKPEAVATARQLAEAVREIDPTRPVTSAMTTWDRDWEIFDPLMAEHDVCGYNYQLHRAQEDHKRVPSRIIVQTESYPRDAFANWKLVQNHPYIIGDFVWTALDYLGESGIGRWYYTGENPGEHYEGEHFPWHGAYCGDVDLTGWRKPISHYRDMLWNGTEKLYMAVREPSLPLREIHETMWSVWPTWESWSWPEMEGKNLQVEVYSTYPSVKLYLNNRYIGEKVTTADTEYKAVFELPYAVGELKVVGIQDGKSVESKKLLTAQKPAQIRLSADRSALKANGQDLSYIHITITDQNGTIDPNAEHPLHFSIDGQGIIAGVDNGNLKDTGLYTGTSRKAWNGRALVVVKSTHQAGEIRLKVSSPELGESIVTLKSSR